MSGQPAGSGPSVEHWRGSAATFHARDIPAHPTPSVWVFDVSTPALVLGSTQRDEIVDHDACATLGVEVVRRRSGGGAVLLDPGEAVWIDVIVPTGHHLADDDVGRATWWLGEVWATVLGDLGVDAEVHRGGMVRTPWSPLVCFAGLGPGEVVVGGAKAVGISQRRTRVAARFQTALALAWRPERLVGLLSPPFPTAPLPTAEVPVSSLVTAVRPVSLSPDVVIDRFVAEVLGHL